VFTLDKELSDTYQIVKSPTTQCDCKSYMLIVYGLSQLAERVSRIVEC